MNTYLTLGLLLALLVICGLLYRARGWLRGVLSESDGTPSSSRCIAFLTALVNVSAFAAWGTYQVVALKQQPDLAAWGTYMGYSQAGGSLPYLFNQLRRGISERDGGQARQVAPGATLPEQPRGG